MKKTVISHFWNEEVLLPYWLKHHRELFDHGILINYRSTDRSVEIIKELVPTWEIHDTVNPDFSPDRCDLEVQRYERVTKEWKIALNITEFLFLSNLDTFISEFAHEFPSANGVRATGVIMVDSEEDLLKPITDKPLLIQRTNGYLEYTQLNPITKDHNISRSRFLHKRPVGGYYHGRHWLLSYKSLQQINDKYGSVEVEHNTGIHPKLFLCWFGKYSPFEAIKERYLNLNKMRTVGRDKNTDEARLEVYYKDLVVQQGLAVNLLENPYYKEQFDLLTSLLP